MTAKKSGALPDQRCKYDEAFKAEALVGEALRGALVVRRPAAGLIVHSDQGSQYTATRFKGLLARHGAQQSMSRRAATAMTTPMPNRFGAASKPNCSMVAV